MTRFRFLPAMILTVVFSALLLAPQLAPDSEAQRGYGMHHGMWDRGPGDYGRGGGWSYCPYCGKRFDDRGDYPTGPGYDPRYDDRRRGGYHMGPGMMGPGYDRRGMMGPDYGRGYGYDRDYRRFEEPLKTEDAKDQVEQMLKRSRNPNLKAGEVAEKDQFFTVEILTKDGSLVDKMQVDKETGMMRSVY